MAGRTARKRRAVKAPTRVLSARVSEEVYQAVAELARRDMRTIAGWVSAELAGLATGRLEKLRTADTRTAQRNLPL